MKSKSDMMRMNTRHGMALMLAMLLALPMMAQKQFTLEDLNFGGNNYRNMIPQNRVLKWWGDQLVRLTPVGPSIPSMERRRCFSPVNASTRGRVLPSIRLR